jgi:hypothetical protein
MRLRYVLRGVLALAVGLVLLSQSGLANSIWPGAKRVISAGAVSSGQTDSNITAIRSSGWDVDYTSPPTFDPVNDPKYLTLSRQGFDTSGNATTYTESLVLTQRVRQAYPNQASLDSTRVALSDYV